MALKIISKPSPNKFTGRSQKIKSVVVHWWDDPRNKPTLDNVVSFLRNPSSQVSAHYVVSDTTIVRLVAEKDTAWHAREANPFTIGIEVDPQAPGKTYETVGQLVKEIRQRHGDLPLKKHSDYVATQCPGTINLSKIENLSKEDEMYNGKTAKQWWERAVELHNARAEYKKLLDKVKAELEDLRNRPPEVVITEVEKIIEKVVEVPVGEDEAVKNWFQRLISKLTSWGKE